MYTQVPVYSTLLPSISFSAIASPNEFSIVIANLTVNSGSKVSFEEWADNLKINIQIFRMQNATLSSKCRPKLVCLHFALAFYFAFTKY